MSIGLTSVKEKKETRSAKIIKNYNLNIRYQYKPTGWITKNLPLLVAPIFSSTAIFIVIAIIIGYLTITNPQFSTLTGEQKGKIAASSTFMLLAPNMFVHYFVTLCIIHPLAKFKKFKTSKSNFLLISLNIFMIFAILSYFLVITKQSNYTINTNISHVFIPFWIFSTGMLATFMYRGFNELYKRDSIGKIIMDDSYYERIARKKENLAINEKNKE